MDEDLMKGKKVALGKRLRHSPLVHTLGLRPNFSDYSEIELDLLRNADTIYYPSTLYEDIFLALGKRGKGMEQARNYVCTECASAVPSGHKFCGACGAPVPSEAQTLDVQYFGAMQMPGKARLIVVRGDEAIMGADIGFVVCKRIPPAVGDFAARRFKQRLGCADIPLFAARAGVRVDVG